MANVSMLEFRKDADRIIRRVQQGQRLVLTYRGKAVMRLEPLSEAKPRVSDPFYALAEKAESAGCDLTNQDIDEILYGG